VQKTSDVVKEGDKVKVKLLGFDDRGKTRLSMKAVDQVTGEDLEAKQKTEAAARSRRRVIIAETAGSEGRLFQPPFLFVVMLRHVCLPSCDRARSCRRVRNRRGNANLNSNLG